MNWKNLIFDIDGTLWDSRALVAEGYNIQLEREGYSNLAVTAEILRPLFGKVMTDIADALLATVPESERYELMERCMETENRHLYESSCDIGYPGVQETLGKLAQEHDLYIVSNAQCGYPELCISKLGLEPYIRGHLCFGDTGTCKAQTIQTLMQKYDLQDCVYIGDTEGDHEAASGAGIPFVWASYGFGVPSGYDAKIDSIEELLNL